MFVPPQTRFPRTRVFLDRVALFSVLVLPLLLMHAHGIAEGAIALADVAFLASCALTRDWRWLRTPWMLVALAWWVWVLLCSVPVPAWHLGEGGLPSFIQALATLRFLVLVAAMEHTVLSDPEPRRWMFGIIAACALYIASMSVFQFIFRRNFLGYGLYGGDTLTGPFGGPRAGPPLARMMMPVLVPPVASLLSRKQVLSSVGAVLLMLAALYLMVIMGQRVPLLLTAFGMLVAGVLLPRLRWVVICTAVLGALLIAASPVIAPGPYQKQVLRFSSQLENFPTSPYGELYARALEIGVRHPVTGRGYDGFRTGCADPRYFRPTLDGSVADGGGAAICTSHPHNFFLQALDDSGFVGLALFCAVCVAWLIPLGRGLWHAPDPLRVGLFAATFIQVWPLQSTSAFSGMPMGGWFFLLLGWGLAEARWQQPAFKLMMR